MSGEFHFRIRPTYQCRKDTASYYLLSRDCVEISVVVNVGSHTVSPYLSSIIPSHSKLRKAELRISDMSDAVDHACRAISA